MSSAAVAIALNHSRATGATLLVLVGIAEHEGEGGSWPSIQRLARYARVTDRNVRKALMRLEDLGEIRRDVQRGGTAEIDAYDRPNRYDFLLTCPPNCDGSARHNPRDKDKPLTATMAPARKRDRRPAVASAGDPRFNVNHPRYDPENDPRFIKAVAAASLAEAEGGSPATGGQGGVASDRGEGSPATPKPSTPNGPQESGSYETQRASAYEPRTFHEWLAGPCPTTTITTPEAHRFNPSQAMCVDCFARPPRTYPAPIERTA